MAPALTWFALAIWTYVETSSVLLSSVLSSAFLLAVISTSMVFGYIVDRYPKKPVMLASDILSAGFFVVGLAVYLAFPEEAFTSAASPVLWGFILMVFAGVVISNIRAIALPTVVTLMVPEDRRDRANGIVGTANGVAYLIAPILGGFLLAIAGMYWVLVASIALRVLAILHLMLFVRIPSREEAHIEAGIPPPAEVSSVDISGTMKLILAVPGLVALIFFNTLNNFFGGIFGPLVNPYGLSLASEQLWGTISGLLSIGFIVGGLLIARFGLGRNPVRTLLLVNAFLWTACALFTVQHSLVLLVLGCLFYMASMPFAEAAEQTILQRVVPPERQGRVIGFTQSVELAASPVSSLLIGPIAQFVAIPYMSAGGAGAALIGGWFGTGDARGIALIFTVAGLVGLAVTLLALRSRSYRELSRTFEQDSTTATK